MGEMKIFTHFLQFLIVSNFDNLFLVGCIGMRMYDNAAYDYFYFSD